MTLPAGLEAVLGYTRFAIGEAGIELPVAGTPQLLIEPVHLHDEAALSAALPGWRVETGLLTPTELPAGWQNNADPWQAVFDADALGNNLALRGRRAGDRFQPLGMDGNSKLLAEYFTNVRLPAAARDRWPLLVNAADQILWVCGLRVDEHARVTDRTSRVLHIWLQRAQD